MDNLAELKFKEWLDKNNVPCWYIDQSLESFSPSLKEFLVKRPDFIILLPNFGFIFVDVKDKDQLDKYEKFTLNSDEVDKYVELQRSFNLNTYFVISNKSYHYKTWFWIPVSNITKSGFVFEGKDGGRYYSIPINEFIQVADTDGLDRVFSESFKFNK